MARVEQELLVEPLPEDIPSTGSTKLSNAGYQFVPYTSSLLLPTKSVSDLQQTMCDNSAQYSSCTANTADLEVLYHCTQCWCLSVCLYACTLQGSPGQ